MVACCDVCSSPQIRSGELELVSLEENAAQNRRLGTMIRALDWGKNAGRFTYNWTAGWFTQPKPYQWSEVPINLGEIIQLVNDVCVCVFHARVGLSTVIVTAWVFFRCRCTPMKSL